jgi:hypothetical protein
MIRLFNWFRRGSLERGLARELQYHFDRRVADLTSAGIPEPRSARKSGTYGSPACGRERRAWRAGGVSR